MFCENSGAYFRAYRNNRQFFSLFHITKELTKEGQDVTYDRNKYFSWETIMNLMPEPCVTFPSRRRSNSIAFMPYFSAPMTGKRCSMIGITRQSGSLSS
jgi:hypothetical protein